MIVEGLCCVYAELLWQEAHGWLPAQHTSKALGLKSQTLGSNIMHSSV